jgi:hypothetical protein
MMPYLLFIFTLLLQPPPDAITLTVQLLAPDGQPIPAIDLRLTQPESATVYPMCTTDVSGVCRWSVAPLRLYLVQPADIRLTVDAVSAAALGHAGLGGGLGYMLGTDDHSIVVYLDGDTVTFADPLSGQPYRPRVDDSILQPALTAVPVITALQALDASATDPLSSGTYQTLDDTDAAGSPGATATPTVDSGQDIPVTGIWVVVVILFVIPGLFLNALVGRRR